MSSVQDLLNRQQSPGADASPITARLASIPNRSVSPFLSQSVSSNTLDSTDIVERHLASRGSSSKLDAQGADIVHDIYKYAEGRRRSSSVQQPVKPRRSMSFSGSTTEATTASDLRIPGGFRRSFIATRPHYRKQRGPKFLTNNFIEFLTLYGHFAGEDLDEDTESETESVFEDEESSLLPREREESSHQATTFKAVLLLLKAFVGTGVLFLPKGFANAGWAFASIALLFCSIISYYCFVLLIRCKVKLGLSSYGDIGQQICGTWMRNSILFSIVISQIGFAAAYTVFTAANMQVFMKHVFHMEYAIEIWILVQALVFLPLSLTRNIAKLSGTALLADLFILLGLIYVYYTCSHSLWTQGLASDLLTVNPKDWTLFIGTAIFTYEGIGLLLPIQQSMKRPETFESVLAWVMVGITVVFISAGIIGYMAFGGETQTVILLNFTPGPMVDMVQMLYAMAILLSTPLQLFPAIRILENMVFQKSGKHNTSVKWKKNIYRMLIVVGTIFIALAGAHNLDVFVALVGSFACVPLIYIYPPLLHWWAMGEGIYSVIDWAITAFGFGVMIYTCYGTIASLL